MSAPPSNKNVEQTKDTSREEVMTFSYDMSIDEKFEKPTYPGTGNGLGGEEGEYDVVVIGSGMGGLACGAMNALYGKKTLVLESHIKPGGSAHTFSRMHNGGKYSFEVGPSIFEGLDKPSLNPLRILIDSLGEEMPVKTYTGLGYWTPEGYWRFPVGSKSNFEDLLREQSDNPELAVEEWNALRKRLKTLGGSTLAVSLLNLRQDQGFLATTAVAAIARRFASRSCQVDPPVLWTFRFQPRGWDPLKGGSLRQSRSHACTSTPSASGTRTRE